VEKVARLERRWLPETGSTQEDALAWIRQKGPTPGRSVAARQKRGLGRGANRWDSPEGGLYLSSLVPVGRRPDSLLPLAVGADLAELISHDFEVDVRLKWPNDLVVEDTSSSIAKLGGLLVDVTSEPHVVVVGVGLNVNTRRSDLSPEVRHQAAVLSELVGRSVDLLELEERVDATIRASIVRLTDPTGRDRALRLCRARIYGVGRPVSLDGRPLGRLVGVADDGALQVEHDGQLDEVRAGDLRVLGAWARRIVGRPGKELRRNSPPHAE
jgi:BirA family transcriptional regulator, biotin operon repressor / biotin---[acetyl-CoA-carboxylase] ligase